jgi:site-specific recombinase XerD
MGLYKRGNTWWIDYYIDGQRVRENTNTTSKRRAEDMLAKIRTEVVEGRLNLQRVRSSPSFSDFSEKYLEYSLQNKKPSSHKRDCLSVKHLDAFFGKRTLRDIQPMLIEHYKKRRGDEGKSPATINREMACLKHMFTIAISWKQAYENPVKQIRMLHEDNEVTNVISYEDEELLLANAAPHLRDILICALDTGMRRSEMFELRWKDVDLKKSALRVVKSKTGKAREIPIGDRLLIVLKRLRTSQSGDHVFISPKTGEKLTKVDTAFRRALERSGIKHRGYRLHDCRHSFASRLIEQGESPFTVQELLGHSSIRTTQRYAHPGAQSKRDAIKKLAARRAKLLVESAEESG